MRHNFLLISLCMSSSVSSYRPMTGLVVIALNKESKVSSAFSHFIVCLLIFFVSFSVAKILFELATATTQN